jgi:hypothetical protein
MESQGCSIDRLLSSLETLVDQEAAQVAAGDHGGVLRTQQRATPVVIRLAELGARTTDASAHARVVALLSKRQRSQHQLAAQIGRVRCELARARESQHRLAGIAPLYFGKPNRRLVRRLSALS